VSQVSTTYRPAIERAARQHLLDPNLVEALVIIESGGDPYAFNPEPRYRYLWDVRRHRAFRKLTDLPEALLTSMVPPKDFPTLVGDRDQEWVAQKASWGLMQVMGAVARELGFRWPFLTQLTDVTANLDAGCLHLGHQFEWADGDRYKALGAYNAGRGGWHSPDGQAYANKVDAKLAEITAAQRAARGGVV
jgi:soluble lytic murein transglycosylase-like protein